MSKKEHFHKEIAGWDVSVDWDALCVKMTLLSEKKEVLVELLLDQNAAKSLGTALIKSSNSI